MVASAQFFSRFSSHFWAQVSTDRASLVIPQWTNRPILVALRPLQNWASFPRPGLRPDIGSSNIPGPDNLPQNLPHAQKICSKICSLAPRLPILFINRVVISLYSIIVPTFSSSSSSLNTAEIGLHFFSWILWMHIFTTLSSFQTHHKIILPTSRRLS